MTDDIVTRLRIEDYPLLKFGNHQDWCTALGIMDEAADEIERLRAEYDFAHKMWGKAIEEGRKQAPEIDRLRAIIKDIANAVTDEGSKPGYHKQQVNYLRTMWFPLWQAISKAVKETQSD